MKLTKDDIANAEKVFRLNLINSITGIKPANLIGTISNDGLTNLGIFSSVVHLGSNPAYLGFILRPTGDVPRHTYENIMENEVYTINSVPTDLVEKAHYTSGKFSREESEFEHCHIEPEFIDGFKAPFVKASPIKLGMRFQEQVPIKLNGTSMIIGSIEHLIIPDYLVADNGYVNLDEGNVAGISGLNTYYDLKKLDQFPFVRDNKVPEWLK
ncbi:MAG: flavin reductase family protein [Flavobacteriales bacterium]